MGEERSIVTHDPSNQPPALPAAAAPRRGRSASFAFALLALTLAGYWGTTEVMRFVNRQRFLATLRTADGESAKRAAWWVADANRTKFAPQVREALARPDISADYREALVYTLGKLRDADAIPPLRALLAGEGSGVVRQAAWLALARIEPQAFLTTAGDASLRRSEWDELGIAVGRVAAGDWAGLRDVLQWAQTGDVDQRQIACRTLDRVVKPLLEAAGRWPVDFRPKAGEVWETARVAEIARRTSEVDLAKVALDGAQHEKRREGVEKNVRRLASGRAYLAWFLVGSDESRERERKAAELNRH